jgi:hypothetical protein
MAFPVEKTVIPAQAGIHVLPQRKKLDARLRGHDKPRFLPLQA